MVHAMPTKCSQLDIQVQFTIFKKFKKKYRIDTQVHQRLSSIDFSISLFWRKNLFVKKPLSPLYRSLQGKTPLIQCNNKQTESSTPPQWLTLQRLGVTSNSDWHPTGDRLLRLDKAWCSNGQNTAFNCSSQIKILKGASVKLLRPIKKLIAK